MVHLPFLFSESRFLAVNSVHFSFLIESKVKKASKKTPKKREKTRKLSIQTKKKEKEQKKINKKKREIFCFYKSLSY